MVCWESKGEEMVVNVHESRNYEALLTLTPTAQEIWSALSKAFYDGSNELQVFTLNQKAFTAKQNGRSLSI